MGSGKVTWSGVVVELGSIVVKNSGKFRDWVRISWAALNNVKPVDKEWQLEKEEQL